MLNKPMDRWGSKLFFSKDEHCISLERVDTYNGAYIPFEMDIISLSHDEIDWFLKELEKSKAEPAGYEAEFKKEVL